MALTSGSMKLTPFQVMTLLAAAAVLIPTTPVRYVTRFDPTPLLANLSTPAITATVQHQLLALPITRTHGRLSVAFAADRSSGMIVAPPPDRRDKTVNIKASLGFFC
nr:unnamed protein product [Digitaria exilis]